jgi:hypothetical protein
VQIESAIPRVEWSSRERLANDFLGPQQPVVISGGGRDWRAREKWDREFLSGAFGDMSVTASICDTHIHPDLSCDREPRTAQIPFREYVDCVWSGDPLARKLFVIGDNAPMLYDECGPSSTFGALLEDIVIPDFLERTALHFIGFWLSAQGIVSWLHYDANGCHNLNVQVRGAKRVLLFSPEQTPCLYPFLRTATGKKFSQFSQVNTESPDLERFPRFLNARCQEAVLEEGDMLFIPAFWFHTFTHLGRANINVNLWWRPMRQLLNGITAREAFLSTLTDVLFGGQKPSSGEEALAWIQKLDPHTVSFVQRLERCILEYSDAT